MKKKLLIVIVGSLITIPVITFCLYFFQGKPKSKIPVAVMPADDGTIRYISINTRLTWPDDAKFFLIMVNWFDGLLLARVKCTPQQTQTLIEENMFQLTPPEDVQDKYLFPIDRENCNWYNLFIINDPNQNYNYSCVYLNRATGDGYIEIYGRGVNG